MGGKKGWPMHLDLVERAKSRARGRYFRMLGQVMGLTFCGVTLLGQTQTGVIYGRVTDSRGHPLHLLVHLLAQGDIPAGDVYTQAEGNYTFEGLPDGEYCVVVEAEGFQSARQRVSIDAHVNPKMQFNPMLEPLVRTGATPSPVVAGSASSHTVDAKQPRPSFDPRALREFDKGHARQQKGDLQQAIGHYEKALHLEPLFYPALNNLGAIYERQGDHKRAEGVLLKALEANPHDGEAYINLGHVLFEEGRYAEARPRLEEGLKRSPNSATGRFFLGSINLKLGDFSGAESNLKRACALDPEGMPAAHLQLANAYLRAGDLTAARAELEHYLRSKPDDPQAPAIRKLLARITAQNN
jgi:Tfp pilus assembly protein PilF